MNKISLVIKREYLTRIRNKTFLLSTFLLPIMMLLLIFGSTFLASKSGDKQQKIAIINDPGFMRNNLKSDSAKVLFSFDATVTDSSNFASKGYDGLLVLSSDTMQRAFKLFSKKTLNSFAKERIESKLDKAYESRQLQNMGISINSLDSIKQGTKTNAVSIDNRLISEEGKSKKVNAAFNSIVGMLSGILIYITMFIFGAMVMRGVMEEKTNRIAEVIVSSIKPFQLMLGKIIGIGAVGLTQLILWIILIGGIMMLLPLFVSADTMHQVQELQKLQQSGGMPGGGGGMAFNDTAIKIADLQSTMTGIPWFKIIFSFLFYFLGGYLFYSSLFAAVGSVINEDPQEAQSLMLPITMPIIFGFIILTSNAGTPDSPAMFWGSMIPFTSPIVMMGRVASDVPWWQLGLSMALLVVGFVFTVWLAGKIYRTGILLYGKKASWKEMIKWAFRKS
jgi:ABC-2 type transport system permease protein